MNITPLQANSVCIVPMLIISKLPCYKNDFSQNIFKNNMTIINLQPVWCGAGKMNQKKNAQNVSDVKILENNKTYTR